MQLKASVWKLSKSAVEIADEFELMGQIKSSGLIYFPYVFGSLADNIHGPNMTFVWMHFTHSHALNGVLPHSVQ